MLKGQYETTLRTEQYNRGYFFDVNFSNTLLIPSNHALFSCIFLKKNTKHYHFISKWRWNY